MSYRPITDVWILARSKVKYYGAYPAGFLQRARDLLGAAPTDQVVHLCGGHVRSYPYSGLGAQDLTVDTDPACKPDFQLNVGAPETYTILKKQCPDIFAILADPPYTPEDADHYLAGRDLFPSTNAIVANSLTILPIGGRVGILSLHWPRYPKAISRQVAVVAVYVGNGNYGRTFAVYERTR